MTESFMKRAKITAKLEGLSYQNTEIVNGTEERIYEYAHKMTEDLIKSFCEIHDITHEGLIKKIEFSATHLIEWLNDRNILMYAVLQPRLPEPIYGVYPTLKEAEEAIETACKKWIEDIYDKGLVYDIYYNTRLEEEKKSFIIQKVPVYGVDYGEED